MALFTKSLFLPYLTLMCMYANKPALTLDRERWVWWNAWWGRWWNAESIHSRWSVSQTSVLSKWETGTTVFFPVVPAKTSTCLLIFFCTKFWYAASLELWTWVIAQIVWLLKRRDYFKKKKIIPIDLHWKRATQISKERNIIENYRWVKKQSLIMS